MTAMVIRHDNPSCSGEFVSGLSFAIGDFRAGAYVTVDDPIVGRSFFGQIIGPQITMNRTGLSPDDLTSIQSHEAVIAGDFKPEAVSSPCYIWKIQIYLDLTSKEPAALRPSGHATVRLATEDELRQSLRLPAPGGTRIGFVDGNAGVGIYLDRSRIVTHLLLAGATGSGKTNVAGNIIGSSVEQGFAAVVLDHKPDYQDVQHPNDESPARKGFPTKHYSLAGGLALNGNSIYVPASDLPAAVLAEILFPDNGDKLQSETFTYLLEIYSETEGDGKKHWTLRDVINWATRNGEQPAAVSGVVGNGFSADARTLAPMFRKMRTPARKPDWIDGQNVRGGQSFSGHYFRLDGSVVEAGKVLVLNVSGASPREYGLFLAYVLRELDRQKTDGRIKCPVLTLIDEAQDIFNASARFKEVAAGPLDAMIRKGRSKDLAFCVAVQAADQVPESIINNLNSRIIMRHNSWKQAKAALPSVTDEQFAETMLYRPGQALVSMAGSVAVVKARMDRSPCKLTVHGGDR